MLTPRENTSIVKAPVLFRLPHLQRAAAAKATAASLGGYSGERFDVATSQPVPNAAITTPVAASPPIVGHSPDLVEREKSATPSKAVATPVQPERLTATDQSFVTRWGFEIKRSIILLAALALLWGAWALGQRSATAPRDESNLAEIDEVESASVTQSVAANDSKAQLAVELPDTPRVAQIVEPTVNSSGSSDAFSPVTEPNTSDRFANAGDAAIGTAAPTAVFAGSDEATSDFSKLSLDALEPPSNGEFYGDYDLGEPATSSAQKPPLTTDTNALNQTALNQPATSTPTEDSLPTATNFVPSATPQLPGFDPNKVGDVGNTAPVNRPALSSTPKGITDWSRYLPGAGGSGSIRAVSATQAIGGATDDAESSDTQAIYLEKNDPESPNVGVAPYYR